MLCFTVLRVALHCVYFALRCFALRFVLLCNVLLYFAVLTFAFALIFLVNSILIRFIFLIYPPLLTTPCG